MKPKILDVIELIDGRIGTILESFDTDNGYMIEISDEEGKTIDTPIVSISDINKIIYTV